MIVQWITNAVQCPFYVRKILYLDKNILRATAKVCGLGQFNFYINGKKISDHVLDPGWTDYRKVIQFVTFDITDDLKKGDNCIGAEIGNGWFIKDDYQYTFAFPAFMPPNPNPYVPYGESLVFYLELQLTYEDGTTEIICSDESFKVHEHPVQRTNVYGSELYDGTKEQTGWNTVSFDDSQWDDAVIAEMPEADFVEQFQPPIKVIHTYEGMYLHSVNGRKIYDFGQNCSFMLEMDVEGNTGDTVKVYPAEKLNEEGDVDQAAKGWCTVNNCSTFILDNGKKLCSTFSYMSGRYVAIEGNAEVLSVKANAISSAWKKAGTFTCDDQRYNRIYDMIEKTVEANMVSVHTDCPTIERFAWQEPNHLMAPSIFFMKDGRNLWEKFLMDCRYAQHTSEDIFHDFAGNEIPAGDGLVPSQAPCYIPNVLPVPGMGSFYDIIPWGSTSILDTYWHYMFYGDKKIIEDNYDMGKRYWKYLQTKVNGEGFINHGLGDWGNPENTLCRENIETAFLYADTVTLKLFAEMLNRKDDAEEFDRYSQKIKENYNSKLLVKNHDTDRYYYKAWDNEGMTQACEALPLYWGLVPEDKKEDVVNAFRETLVDKGSFVSGEIGLPYIIQCASEYGMDDIIAKYITKETHPSYYAFILDGETTLGEYWESNPRSHCHDMMGHIIEWYYRGMAGIRILKPGFKEIEIKPYLPSSVNHMECTYQTEYGKISVSLARKNGIVHVQTEIPDGIRYTVDDTKIQDN